MNKNIIASDSSLSAEEKTRLYNGYFEFIASKPGIGIDDALQELYRIIDTVMDEHFTDKTCKKGCYHCCDVAVGITGYEAAYIHSKTGHNITKMETNVKFHKGRYPLCPFLVKGNCSIYEFRPAVCRVFISFDDPQRCIDGLKHRSLALFPPGKNAPGLDLFNMLYYNAIRLFADNDPKKHLMHMNELRAFFDLPPGTPK